MRSGRHCGVWRGSPRRVEIDRVRTRATDDTVQRVMDGHVHHRVHARFLRRVITNEARGDRSVPSIRVPGDHSVRAPMVPVLGLEVVIHRPVAHLRADRIPDHVSRSEMDARPDARVDDVTVQVGSELVVPVSGDPGGPAAAEVMFRSTRPSPSSRERVRLRAPITPVRPLA